MYILKMKILLTFDKIFMFIFQKLYGVRNKYAVFESYCGVQYSDNPRTISEKLHEIDPEYKIIWLLKDTEDKYGIIPNYVKKVKYTRLNRVKEIAKCSVYVTNENLKPGYYKNKKKQFYIQTWHGDRPLKKILYDTGYKLQIPIADNKYTNICIAGSKIGEEIYRTAFHYYGEVLVEGSPRNDKLVIRDLENEKRVKNILNLNGKNILLYAPTFKDNDADRLKVNVDILNVIDILEKKYNNEWICLMRSHPSHQLLEQIKSSKVIDVSDYPDMADILSITDILITDYSSSCGDFIVCKKPTILCQFDKDYYVNNCREFRINPEEVGFIIAYNQKQLENIICNNNYNDYKKNCELVMKNLGVKESGKSAEKVCQVIKNWDRNIRIK